MKFEFPLSDQPERTTLETAEHLLANAPGSSLAKNIVADFYKKFLLDIEELCLDDSSEEAIDLQIRGCSKEQLSYLHENSSLPQIRDRAARAILERSLSYRTKVAVGRAMGFLGRSFKRINSSSRHQ